MRALQWLVVIILVFGCVSAPVVRAQGGTETYTSDDGLLTVNYPVGWTVTSPESNVYNIGSATDYTLIQIFTTPAVDEFMLNWGFDSTVGANVVGNLVSSRLPEDPQGRSMEFISAADGRQLCLYYLSDPTQGDELWLLTLEVPETGAVIMLLMFTHPGEADPYRDMFLAVAESVRYAPPAEVPAGSVVWQYELKVEEGDPLSFSGVGGIDADANSILYVADPANGIVTFTPDGEQIARLDPFAADASIGDVAVAADGTLYALDSKTGVIYHLDAAGVLLETLGEPTLPERWWRNIEIHPDGLFVVQYVEGEGETQVRAAQIRDLSGAVQSELDLTSQLMMDVASALSIDIGPDGNIYVMDLVGQLLVLDLQGNLVRDYGMLMMAANAIALQTGPDGSVFFAADWGGVWYFNADGDNLGDLAQNRPTTTSEGYFQPGGLVLLPDGDLVLADRLGETVVLTRFRFDAYYDPTAGMPTPETGSSGGGHGESSGAPGGQGESGPHGGNTLPELAETYTSNDGTLALQYPTGWTTMEPQASTIVLVTDQTILGTQNYGPDDVMMMLNWFSLNDPSSTFAPTTELTPLGIAGELRDTMQQQAPTAILTDPVPMTLNGHDAAQFSSDITPTSMVVWVLDLGNDEIAFIVLNTASDQIARFTPLGLAVVESLNYTP